MRNPSPVQDDFTCAALLQNQFILPYCLYVCQVFRTASRQKKQKNTTVAKATAVNPAIPYKGDTANAKTLVNRVGKTASLFCAPNVFRKKGGLRTRRENVNPVEKCVGFY